MKTKMAALFATVLIALAVLGFSYAYWTETLKIEGSVETGTLDVEFSGATCTDNEVSIDVGTCTVTTNDQTMTVTIENAYPSYECTVTFDIKNTGTIPAKCTAITITAPAELTATLTGIAKDNIIAVGEIKSCTLTIHVENSAAEEAPYTLTVTIDFGQGT